jgi:MFS transporter, DHA3 family, macrolide efflux protein
MPRSLSLIRELRILRPFLIICFGQLVSVIGSSLASFALDLWVYQKTGSVTQYAIVSLCITLPPMIISPLAGTLIDQWNHLWTMFFSDLGAGIVILSIAVVFYFNQLHIWYICLAIGIMCVCNVFRKLAATIATNKLVPKRHLGRALGVMEIGKSVSSIFAPALSGILLLSIQLQGVLLLDCITYLLSLGTLLIVRFPNNQLPVGELDALKLHKSTDDSNRLDNKEIKKFQSGLFIEKLAYGWRYICSRSDFTGLILYLLVNKFLVGMVGILMMPMLLSFVSTATTGKIISIGGFGALLGSIAIGIWGGPKRRINGILGLGLFLGVCIVAAGLRPSITLITASIFGGLFCFPIVEALSQALFLAKIPSQVQGRVFGLLNTMVGVSLPLAYLLAGPLVDLIFEPLLAVNGSLVNNVGMVIGVGKGRGIGLLFIVLGLLQVAISVIAYTYRPLRTIDRATAS